MSPPLAASQNKNEVALAKNQKVTAHAMRPMKEWHKHYPDKIPLCGTTKCKLVPNVSEDGKRVNMFFSRNGQRLDAIKVLTVTSPIRYQVYYLPIPNEDGIGMFVRYVTGGQLYGFLKGWVGGEKYSEQCVAVRVTSRDGRTPPFPGEDEWKKYDKYKLPSEEQAEKATISSKRSRGQNKGDTKLDLMSPSSSGGDIPHQRSKRRRFPGDSSADFSDGASEDEDEDEGDGDYATPVGLTNGGLPTYSRPVPHTEFVHRQRPLNENRLRKSLPNLPFVNTPGTAGSEISRSSSSPFETTIKFILTVPTLRTSRTLRTQNNEDKSEYIFNEALAFFRHHDNRPLRTLILVCVIEGEGDSKWICDAEELSDFTEELREGQGVV